MSVCVCVCRYPQYHAFSYIMDRARAHGIFVNEHLDFAEEVARQKLLRGVLPVKKGEGRRALAKAGSAKDHNTQRHALQQGHPPACSLLLAPAQLQQDVARDRLWGWRLWCG